jgi:hypothetical protein
MDLSFKIVKMVGPHDEVIVRSSNFLICQAAFEKALFIWPNEHLEMRQGARDYFEVERGQERRLRAWSMLSPG